MTKRRVLAVLLLGFWILTACGGDGSEASPDAESIRTTAAASTTASSSTTLSTTAPSSMPSPPSTSPPPTTSAPPTTSPPPTPSTTVEPPALTSGDDHRVFVLGDSTLLGAAATVPAALVGWSVTFDAVGSRRLPQGLEVLRARRSEIGRVVVIQTGNNFIADEGPFGAQIDQAMGLLDGVQRVVWLTVAEKWPSRVAINDAIRASAQRWPQIVVADWAGAIAAHSEYAEDMLHLSSSGREAIARLIAAAVGPP